MDNHAGYKSLAIPALIQPITMDTLPPDISRDQLRSLVSCPLPGGNQPGVVLSYLAEMASTETKEGVSSPNPNLWQQVAWEALYTPTDSVTGD